LRLESGRRLSAGVTVWVLTRGDQAMRSVVLEYARTCQMLFAFSHIGTGNDFHKLDVIDGTERHSHKQLA